MSLYGIDLPCPEPSNHAQAMRDAHDAQIRKSLKPEQMRTDILEHICLGMLTNGHVFNHLLQTMLDAPIQDDFDRDGYLKYCSSRDARKLGEALMQAAADACLKQVREVDNEPF
jgi:hypothetical protein